MTKRRAKRGDQDATSESEDGLSISKGGNKAGDLKVSKKQATKRGSNTHIGNGRTDEDLSKLDPKTVRRILANRQSAAKSKERKQMLAQELERRLEAVVHESMRISMLQTDLHHDVDTLQTYNKGLEAEVEDLTMRLTQIQTSQAVLLKELSHALKVLHLPPGLPAAPTLQPVPPQPLPGLRLPQEVDQLCLAVPVTAAALQAPLLSDGPNPLGLQSRGSGPLAQTSSVLLTPQASVQVHSGMAVKMETEDFLDGGAGTGVCGGVNRRRRRVSPLGSGVVQGTPEVVNLEGPASGSAGGGSKGSAGEREVRDSITGNTATTAGQLQFSRDGTLPAGTPREYNRSLQARSGLQEISPSPSKGALVDLGQPMDSSSPAHQMKGYSSSSSLGLPMAMNGDTPALGGPWSTPQLGGDMAATGLPQPYTSRPKQVSAEQVSIVVTEPSLHTDLLMKARQSSQHLAAQQQHLHTLEAQLFTQGLLNKQQQQQQQQQQVSRRTTAPGTHASKVASAAVWQQQQSAADNASVHVSGAGTKFFSAASTRTSDSAARPASAPAVPTGTVMPLNNTNGGPAANGSPVTGEHSQSGAASGGGLGSNGNGGSGMASDSPFAMPPRPSSGAGYGSMGRMAMAVPEDGPSSGGSDVLLSYVPFQRVSLMSLLQQQQAGLGGRDVGMAQDSKRLNNGSGNNLGLNGIQGGLAGPQQLVQARALAQHQWQNLPNSGSMGMLSIPQQSPMPSIQSSPNPLLSSISAQQQLQMQLQLQQLPLWEPSDTGSTGMQRQHIQQQQQQMYSMHHIASVPVSSDLRFSKRKSLEDWLLAQPTQAPHHRAHLQEPNIHNATLQPVLQQQHQHHHNHQHQLMHDPNHYGQQALAQQLCGMSDMAQPQRNGHASLLAYANLPGTSGMDMGMVGGGPLGKQAFNSTFMASVDGTWLAAGPDMGMGGRQGLGNVQGMQGDMHAWAQ